MKKKSVPFSIVQDIRDLSGSLRNTKLVRNVQVSKELSPFLVDSSTENYSLGIRISLRKRAEEMKLEGLLRRILCRHHDISDKSILLTVIKRYLPYDEKDSFVFIVLYECLAAAAKDNQKKRLIHQAIRRSIYHIKLWQQNEDVMKRLQKAEDTSKAGKKSAKR